MKELKRKYTPEEKLLLAESLYFSAKALKKAALKSFYPELTDKEIEKKVRDWMMYGKT